MPGSGSSSSVYRLALPVGFQLEEHRIVRVLGQGGFGITYLAYDTRLTIEVAIHAITGHVPPLSMDRLGSRDPFEPVKQRCRDRHRENFLKALDAAFAVRPEDRLRSAAEWRRMLAADSREPQPKSKQNRLPSPDKKVDRAGKAKRETSASASKAKSPLWLSHLC